MSLATDMRDKYLAAEAAILEGKQVRLGERLLVMEDLPAVIAGRKEWEQRAAQESAAANRTPTLGGVRFSVANFSGTDQ